MGLLSPEMYVDSSLVKADVSGYGLAHSGLTVAEFKGQAIEENGLFKPTDTTVVDEGVEHEEVRYFQSPEGRMPLSPVDTDVRWRNSRTSKSSGPRQISRLLPLIRHTAVQRTVSRALKLPHSPKRRKGGGPSDVSRQANRVPLRGLGRF